MPISLEKYTMWASGNRSTEAALDTGAGKLEGASKQVGAFARFFGTQAARNVRSTVMTDFTRALSARYGVTLAQHALADIGLKPASKLEGKTILFTTTNGAKAILSCRGAVYIASFLNAEAVARRLLAPGAPERVSIVCAGTDGQYTEEDLLLAGLLADRLTSGEEKFALNVQAEVVREQYRVGRGRPLVDALKASRGGQNLKRVKLLGDVYDAAKIDSLDVVPEFRDGEIRIFTDSSDASIQ